MLHHFPADKRRNLLFFTAIVCETIEVNESRIA